MITSVPMVWLEGPMEDAKGHSRKTYSYEVLGDERDHDDRMEVQKNRRQMRSRLSSQI